MGIVCTRLSQSQHCLLLLGFFWVTEIVGIAQNRIPPATVPTTTKELAPSQSKIHANAQLAQNCPDYSGDLSAVGVPVGQSVELVLHTGINGPAPAGGLTFSVTSSDNSIIAVGSAAQGFTQDVFTPEGADYSSPFVLFGLAVGQANLVVQELAPQSGGAGATPMSAWAVNPGGFSSFLDANSPSNNCRDEDSPNLSSNSSILAICGSDANGVVSDGVSQLLLRIQSGLEGQACYSIASTSMLDQGTVSPSVTNTQGAGDFNYGFALYQAPAQYGDNSANRQVDVQFSFAPSGGTTNTTTTTATLTVIRPPVVLIHGLWSNQGAWSGGTANWFRSDPSYQTYVADYGSTNAANFSVNFPNVQNWVASGLQQVRDLGFAATQADVVGHSMGGILTRLYVGSSQYLRNDNFNLGDIHRLVTLDTPHAGASLANLIVSMSANSTAFAVLGPVVSGIASLFDAPGNINDGAVCDLSENSPALQGLNGGTNLRSQVVTGTGGPAGNPTTPAPYFSPLEGTLTQQICIFHLCTYIFPQNVVNGFRFIQQNDQIVSLTSQQALAGGGGSYQTGYIHTAVEKQADVATEVFNLLDGPNGAFLSSFPGVNSNGFGNPVTVSGTGAASDRSDYASQCVGLLAPLEPELQFESDGKQQPRNANTAQARLRARAAQAPDSRIQIVSPTNGQQFAPGDTVNVLVQVTSPLTVNTGWVGTNIPGVNPAQGSNYAANSYNASFVIPTTFSGSATLTPAVLDSNGNPYPGLSSAINIVPLGQPLSLSILQPYTHLSSSTATAGIYVTGNYASGVQLNLTSSVTGTTYSSSNTTVLTVDSDGNVQAKAFGTAVVTVQNKGLTAFANFVIENPTSPLSPQETNTAFNISLSGLQLNRNTGFYVQTATLTNISSTPIAGPLYLVLANLATGVTLTTTPIGLTKTIAPVGSPYLRLQFPAGATLAPGASISIPLQFLNAGRGRITYTPNIFRFAGTP